MTYKEWVKSVPEPKEYQETSLGLFTSRLKSASIWFLLPTNYNRIADTLEKRTTLSVCPEALCQPLI